jgi:hypothetical protein
MKDYLIIILFILFVLFYEKVIKLNNMVLLVKNFSKIKFIIKNILLILPFITFYFSSDKIIDIVKEKKIKKNKRNLNNNIKKYVAANQKWRCNSCNNLLDASYEIDHIIPLYKNGTNNINNLQALCRNCHGNKTINDSIS